MFALGSQARINFVMTNRNDFSRCSLTIKLPSRRAGARKTFHRILALHPEICLEALNDGSAAFYVLSKFRLGTEYVADLVIVGYRSMGYPVHCFLVELESLVAKSFTKRGVPGALLNQAIRQVTEWQHWLREPYSEFTISVSKTLEERHEIDDRSLDKNL